MEIIQLSSYRPYLLRAFYEWFVDNQLTPHIIVDINVDGVILPTKFAYNGQIILNIAPCAVANLALNSDEIKFNACFNGVSYQIIVPIAAIIAIYARENGTGTTMFEPETIYQQLSLLNNYDAKDKNLETTMLVNMQTNNIKDKPLSSSSSKPLLRVVK